jgi:hypothetical protein
VNVEPASLAWNENDASEVAVRACGRAVIATVGAVVSAVSVVVVPGSTGAGFVVAGVVVATASVVVVAPPTALGSATEAATTARRPRSRGSRRGPSQ